MQYILKFILLSTLCCVSGFNLRLNLPTISRKQFCNQIGASVIYIPRMVFVDEENIPLTLEEMEEYDRLLKEAEWIKSVIDLNKKSFLGDHENGIKKYLDEKCEIMVKN